MIRNDFVSNSSSSSFIVSSEDNKYDIILQEYEIYTLDQYLDHFLNNEIFHYMWSSEWDIDKFTFVNDALFNRKFGRNISRTLPEECKQHLEAYIKLYQKQPNDYKSKEYSDWSKSCRDIMDIIKDICKKALQLKWKDVKFHYSEISDDFYDFEREDCVDNKEELFEERINYIDSIKPLKFFRIFNNH